MEQGEGQPQEGQAPTVRAADDEAAVEEQRRQAGGSPTAPAGSEGA